MNRLPEHRRSAPAAALAVLFATVLAIVPVTQTLLDLGRGGRVQATDVLRYAPTAKQLRAYERALEEASWFEQQVRPRMQWFLFEAFRDAGPQAMPGLDSWLFYRPDVRYLLEPDLPQGDRHESRWVPSREGGTARDAVVRRIVEFRDQLRTRGIELLVLPIPGKPSIYPDRLTRRAAVATAAGFSPTADLLARLQRERVAAVDLLPHYAALRGMDAHEGGALYLQHDTHWTPRGVEAAAALVAARLRELRWVPPSAKTYERTAVRVRRRGDILGMTQIPGIGRDYPPESVVCQRITDPALGPLIPSASDRPGTYRCPGPAAGVLLLGDSFSRIYQFAEPASLGEIEAPAPVSGSSPAGGKRLLPGSAGLVSHLAAALGTPVDAIVSDGGAATAVRQQLSTHPEILEGKRVVVWEFVERDLALGAGGWEWVPLPPALGGPALGAAETAMPAEQR